MVARGPGARSAADAHSRGVGAAQRGLDLLSIRGSGDLLIRRAEDESLSWWSTEDDQRFIRATSVAPLKVTVGAAVRVTDASGAEKPVPDEPTPSWHPSFRYFRLAQVSEEVFDAYRNLYLALESILSTATPLRTGEREFDWFVRALTEAAAAGLDLGAFAPAGASDFGAAIRGDLYADTRTATFHAKAGERVLLPLDPVDRQSVIDRLSRLAGLYLALVNQTLGVRRLSGAMMKGGFDLVVGRLVTELKVHATDDDVRVDETATSLNPGGGLVKKLATRPFPELDQPFVRTIIGEASVKDLAELRKVTRVMSVARDGTPVTAGQLEAPLTLGGFDLFEAVMAVRGLNVRLPRTFYSA